MKEGVAVSNPEKPEHPSASGAFFDLGHPFERILRSWGAAHIRYFRGLFQTEAGLPMERTVELSGTLNGTLVVRSSAGFSDWLRTQRGDTPLGRYPEDEIFDEMVSLFCLYLFHDFWNPLTFTVGPIRPLPSTPRTWPGHPPHASCALMVEGQPVELRLWMKD